MIVIVGFLVFGLVVAIAAVFVIREAGRIAIRPPAALFDPEDAYDWVVDHLPDDVAATLTPDDVRRILEFQLEFFERNGVTGNGNGGAEDSDVVIGSADQLAFIVERAHTTGETYIPEQVRGVIETQLSYLRAVGAIGPVVTPPEQG